MPSFLSLQLIDIKNSSLAVDRMDNLLFSPTVDTARAIQDEFVCICSTDNNYTYIGFHNYRQAEAAEGY